MNPGNDWIEQGRRFLETLKSGLAEAAPAGPTSAADADADAHGSDCRWCPVCQAAAVVRGERPEVTAALADVLASAAAALRTFAEAAEPQVPEDDVETEEDGDPPAVQRIDIA
jgi:hypothetical protein